MSSPKGYQVNLRSHSLNGKHFLFDLSVECPLGQAECYTLSDGSCCHQKTPGGPVVHGGDG